MVIFSDFLGLNKWADTMVRRKNKLVRSDPLVATVEMVPSMSYFPVVRVCSDIRARRSEAIAKRWSDRTAYATKLVRVWVQLRPNRSVLTFFVGTYDFRLRTCEDGSAVEK